MVLGTRHLLETLKTLAEKKEFSTGQNHSVSRM